MKKIIRLTEKELRRTIKKMINEQELGGDLGNLRNKKNTLPFEKGTISFDYNIDDGTYENVEVLNSNDDNVRLVDEKNSIDDLLYQIVGANLDDMYFGSDKSMGYMELEMEIKIDGNRMVVIQRSYNSMTDEEDENYESMTFKNNLSYFPSKSERDKLKYQRKKDVRKKMYQSNKYSPEATLNDYEIQVKSPDYGGTVTSWISAKDDNEAIKKAKIGVYRYIVKQYEDDDENKVTLTSDIIKNFNVKIVARPGEKKSSF